MSDGKKRTAAIVHQQKRILVDFMQSHEELVSSKFSSTFTKQTAQNLWDEVTVQLNAVPGGSKKTWNQWRKTWQDIKKNTKAKAVADKKYERGTGGGSVITTKIDDTDTKVLDLILPKAIFGDLIPVPEVIFEFGNDFELDFDHNLTIKPSTINENVEIVGKLADEHKLEDGNKENKLIKNKQAKNTNKLPPRKRFSKTKKLEISTSISSSLVKIEEEKKSAAVAYYGNKMKYLKWRKIYEKRKIILLQEQNNLNIEIIKGLQNVKEAFIRHTM